MGDACEAYTRWVSLSYEPHRPSILLVDDDVSAIRVLSAALRDEGQLRFASSGREALRLAEESLPDVVLLDAEMPGMSGLETCRAMKQHPSLRDVPVIMVTAHTSNEVEAAVFEAGGADFLRKPVVASQVVARVRVHLRRKASLVVATSDASSQHGHPRDRKARVLIVDDDPLAVQATHRALASSGVTISFATNSSQALQLALAQPPDLVLLDLELPDVDGYETCRIMQASPELQNVPIVFVTRHSDPEHETRALEAGATDFIAKPYSPAVLQARVRSVLRLKSQADAALREEREHWRRVGEERVAEIVGSASDAIVTADVDGTVVLINAAACRMFHVSTSEAIGKPLARLLDLNDGNHGNHDATGPAAAPRCLTLVHAGGPRIPVEISTSTVGRGADRLTTIVLRDLTERDRAETAVRARMEAESESRAKTMMLSYIAHEIGNPLNAILGFAQLMEADAAHRLPEPQQVRLSYMLTAGRHLQGLVRDVLALNRFEAGHFEFCSERVDVGVCVHEAVCALAAEAANAGFSIVVTAHDAEASIVADPARLRQCILNVVSNAIKYRRAPGHAEVTIRSRGGRVLIGVRDDGIGMDADQREQLFQPFNRLGRPGPGSGIGLVLTRLLTLGMGGELTVSSEPDEGSLFEFSFPTLPP